MATAIPETRGRPRKYDFSKMKAGQIKGFDDLTTSALLNAANYYAKKEKLRWRFRCYTVEKKTFIVRVR